MITDSRGYKEIIDGTKNPPDEKEVLEILEEDDEKTKKSKKEKLAARMANKKGHRDLVMSTDSISLNIVEMQTQIAREIQEKLGEDSRRDGTQKQEKTK